MSITLHISLTINPLIVIAVPLILIGVVSIINSSGRNAIKSSSSTEPINE